MRPSLLLIVILLPLKMLAQVSISGRVVNQADKKAIAGASVFLSNATVGTVSSDNGNFKLKDVKPGKYDLVVSNIGFETYAQVVIVSDRDIALPDINLVAKTIALKEVKVRVKTDANREVYLNQFKDEFLGTSELAKDCTIINPEVLDFDYDKEESKLSASSDDFLVIENDALGYRIKYLLKDFSVQTKDPAEKKVFYKGPYLFEKLKGSPGQERRWERRRLEAYQNSPMHFLRALLHDRLTQENFLVRKLVMVPNAERPSEQLIDAHIKYYSSLPNRTAAQRDWLNYWTKKQKLPAKIEVLMPDTLHRKTLLDESTQPGLFELNTDNSGLVVSYSESRHFHMNTQFNYLYNAANHETTLLRYNSPIVSFYSNGLLSDPYSLINNGVWARHRVAELLPIDYEPPAASNELAPEETISAKLKAFIATNPVEKVYLHFNQPYYAAGDTLYFKAYVTTGERHAPSALSGVLHVDLINTQNKIDQSIRLQLINGVVAGDFTLPDSLPNGNYRVRAWTRWMRNDPGSFFEKEISIVTTSGNNAPVAATKNSKVQTANPINIKATTKADLQFFPEGGELVTGIANKIAFKAINATGAGIDAKGVIIDNENKQAGVFAATRLGMGSFMLTPVPGKTYRAVVTFADGTKDERPLPGSTDKGIVLSVNSDSLQKVTVKLEANKSYYEQNKNKSHTLLIYSGGIATTVDCALDSAAFSVDLVKRKLFTGVNSVTLFASNGEPVAERLFFIQNHDQLSLNIVTDKKSYHTRDKVSLKLTAKTRADSLAAGWFSVSVTDEGKVPASENEETTMLTSLLLTSDLKGYIEQPNYYFVADSDGRKQKELDLVMLTNGYRRFAWKQVLGDTVPQPHYQPEMGLEIKGTVTSFSGKPTVKGAVSLLMNKGSVVFSGKTDDKGNFAFSNLIFTDTTHFILAGSTEKGKTNTKVIYRPEVSVPGVNYRPEIRTDTSKFMAAYLDNHNAQLIDYARHGGPNGHLLKEVNITATKRPKLIANARYGIVDQEINGDELISGKPLAISLMTMLRGVTFITAGGNRFIAEMTRPHFKGAMMVIWNDVEMGQGFDLNQIHESVESVQTVLNDPLNPEGVLIINTAGGLQPRDMQSHTGHLLKEVKVKGVKDDSHYASSNLAGPGHADQVMHAEEVEKIGGSLSTSLNGRLRGVILFNSVAWLETDIHSLQASPMLIVLDGVEMGKGFPVDRIKSTDVETVEVLRFGSASIYGSEGGNGVLVITTKQGKGVQSKDLVSEGFQTIAIAGFYKAREFYSPKYEHPTDAANRPDLRSTIFWKPDLVTDTNGNASIEYYNADGKGTYCVIIEGIDTNGNLGRVVYRYKVE